MPAPERVIERLEADFDRAVEDLKKLSRIPSVSADGFDPGEVVRSAEEVAELLRACGLADAEVLRLEGAHPYVVASWLEAGKAAPTLLLYAHHDVQPPGRVDRWITPPFEPTERSDGRLYGRGVVDDKAGAVVFAAAIRAWLETEGRLPVNVKLIIEGEEEIGSGHLQRFLEAHRERLSADVIVLSDTANLETGIPSITTSLRGLITVDVRVRALDHPVHSGMWGGPVPDAATALGVLLGRLHGPDAEVAIEGFEEDVPALTADARKALAALPFDAAAFRRDAGLVDSAPLRGADDGSVYERLWLRPALAVTALEGMKLSEAGNQLISEAAARVGVRVAPGQDAARLRDRVVAFLRRDPPFGVEVEVEAAGPVDGWRTVPEGPAFEAAERALRLGYGRDPVYVGCGGTIPFVGPFAEVMGGVPALLLGLEDPPCNAHGENESLDLGDFRRALLSAAHLFDELRGYPVRSRA